MIRGFIYGFISAILVVLIGYNGCGKSTFINNILKYKIKAMNKDNDHPIEFLYKDFAEDMRTKDNSDDQDKFMIGITSYFKSRGVVYNAGRVPETT